MQTRNRNPNRPLTAAEIDLLLNSLDNVRDDALIRLGLSAGLRVSEVLSITPAHVNFERGVITVWDEKKDRWREIMPTLHTIGVLRRYLNTFDHPPRLIFECSAKTIERTIQRAARRALGRVISWHTLRHTYVSRSAEDAQSMAVVMANTGDSPTTILRHYTRLPESAMRRFVEQHPVIPPT